MSTTPETDGLVIGAGYSIEDGQQITYTLEHLLPYLNPDSLCISGGVATAAQLSRAGKLTEPRPLNDVDIVVGSVTDIRSGLTQAFKIEEIDINNPVDDLFVKVEDRQTRLKVDIFGATRFPPETESAQFGEQSLSIRSAPNIGALLLCDATRRIREKDLENLPAQCNDLFAILETTDMDAIIRNWEHFSERTIGGDREHNTPGRMLNRIVRFLNLAQW